MTSSPADLAPQQVHVSDPTLRRILHDLKNTVHTVTLSVEVLAEEPAILADDGLKAIVDSALEASARALAVIQELMVPQPSEGAAS